MPVTRTVVETLYKYDELPTEEAKEKARQWWADCETADFDTESMTDGLVESAEHHYGLKFSEEPYWDLDPSCPVFYFRGRMELDVFLNVPKMSKKHPRRGGAEWRRLAKDVRWLRGSGASFYVTSDVRGGAYQSCHLHVGLEDGPTYLTQNYKTELEEWLRQAPAEIEGKDLARGCWETLSTTGFDCAPWLVYFDWCEEHGKDCAEVRTVVKKAGLEGEKESKYEARWMALEEGMELYIKAACQDLKRVAMEDYDSHFEKDYIEDNIRINEYTFDEDGKRMD